MAGVAEEADIELRSNDPDIVEFRKNQPPGQVQQYIRVVSQIDAIHYVAHAAPVDVLMQFANFERFFDKTSMQHYIDAASKPKKVLWYDTGHELNDPQALRDRYAWLAAQIGITAGITP